ncbi:MAG TPA: thioredoxin domain-containing protein [Bdellovibrionota bacterium]|nr:thioredoxin domain-containing protein [Bdellovibrionota bacterium]
MIAPATTKKNIRWILALSAVGILDSIWLLVLHLSTGSLSNACAVSSFINCDLLHFSAYSEVLSVPVPAFSIIFYSWMLTVVLAAWKRAEADATRPAAYLRLMSWGGLFVTVYFASLSAFVLKAICPFCTLLYAVNIALWIVTWRWMKGIGQPWGHLVRYDLRRAHKSPWLWIPGAAFLFVIIALPRLFPKPSLLSEEQHSIASEDRRSLGLKESPITVVEFADFQCPFCKVVGEFLRQLESEMRGRVRLVYKFFPLDKSCNPSGGMHLYACHAAFAAFCASLQDRFWEYSELLFSKQEDLPDRQLYAFAKELGLDLSKFDRCMNDDLSRKEIRKDIQEGHQLKIRGTPALFINGKLYSGPPTLDAIRQAISNP